MNDFTNRIEELAERCERRGIFVYTDFLNPTKAEEAGRVAKSKGVKIEFYGGTENAERVMARLGDKEEFGYDEEYPVKLLKIECTGGKFASPITHRDVLGAILNLGIDRDKTGDIFVNGIFVYIFAEEKIAEFILKELESVGRNAVKITEAKELPDEFKVTIIEMEISVSSNRVDAIISRLYGLSREQSSALFKNGFAAINGKQTDKGEKELREGDVVAVRGKGKFKFLGEGGTSKKGKLYVRLGVYE